MRICATLHARTLASSPYTLEQCEEILYREVYPVCIPNMRCVAGEWAGFDEQSLEEAILKHTRRRWTISNVIQPRRWMIREDWNQVKEIYYGPQDEVVRQ